MPYRLPELVVLKDRREQKGWDFEPEEKVSGKMRIKGMEWATLDAADYTLKGFEDVVRIERKAGVCELFGNMIPKDNKDRFEREMEKLRGVRHKYIVIEDHMTNDMMGLTIPQFYKGAPGIAVVRWLFELQLKYDIVPVFAGNAGKKVARTIFESVIRKYM